MAQRRLLRWITLFASVTLAVLVAQQPRPGLPPGVVPPGFQSPAPPAPAQPAQPTPAQPAQTPAAPATPPTVYGSLSLNNASLTEVIDLLAHKLKINYILDPRVKGGVILNTYGETKDIDTRSLLETILRINGFGMVKQGDLYRIVPLTDISHLPLDLDRIVDSKDIPEDDRTMLNLVFLKYVTAEELAKVLDPFLGESARVYAYAPANLIFLLDSHRNMRRLLELISLFDSDTLANQRVHLFEVKNGQPSDIAKELETIVKSISLNEKNAPLKFLPINRINTILAVAPNPGAFIEIEKWIKKLDVPIRSTAGAIDNYVYRVRYQQAQILAAVITMLYGGNPNTVFGGGAGGYGFGGMGAGMGGMGGLGNNIGFGNGVPGAGNGNYGGYGNNNYGGYGNNSYGGYGNNSPGGYGGAPIGSPLATAGTGALPTGGIAGVAPEGLTGQYLGAGGTANRQNIPRIIPNPLDNTLLVQAKPEEWDSIQRLLKQLDVPPRQVLIEAKIYEVDLNGAFSGGVSAYLQTLASSSTSTTTGSSSGTVSLPSNQLLGSVAGGAINLTAGALVGKARQLLGFVQLQEQSGKAKSLSAPSLIATDSIPASITVGDSLPTLSSQALVGGATVSGTTPFANTISQTQTGTTLNIVARVNPSGIVTLMINQTASAPIANPLPSSQGGSISSPSFSNRTVQTQVTVRDGDTIAIAGIINESDSLTTSGIPGLQRIPWLGMLFGSRSTSHERTELIIFMTPRVIYDMSDLNEASDELKMRMRALRKIVVE